MWHDVTYESSIIVLDILYRFMICRYVIINHIDDYLNRKKKESQLLLLLFCRWFIVFLLCSAIKSLVVIRRTCFCFLLFLLVSRQVTPSLGSVFFSGELYLGLTTRREKLVDQRWDLISRNAYEADDRTWFGVKSFHNRNRPWTLHT